MNRALILLALLTSAVACGQDRPPMRGDSIGVNTAIQPFYYQDSYAYANAYKAASDWAIDWSADPSAKVSVDKAGGLILPEGHSATIKLFYESPAYPLGRYVVTFAGDGDFRANNKDIIKPPGRFEVVAAMNNPAGLWITCTRSNPKDPVRITAVWSPGYEGSKATFRDEYVRGLKGFSPLRFVQDQNIIGGSQSSWKTRAMMGDARWVGDAGVPIEALCELANASGGDAWFCIPHLADDDYVRKMAKLVKRELSAARKVYVEYDCEMWNWAFKSSQWQKDRHAPAGKTDPKDDNFYGQTDWYPWRAAEVHRIWEEEWKGADRARLVTVIAGQSSWPDRGRWLLGKAKGFRGGKAPCDAYAVAPYFYPSAKLVDGSQKLLDPATTLDALFADLRANLATIGRESLGNRKVADDFGVRLVAYEAGQHLQANDPATAEAYIKANRDPRMGELYGPYLGLLFDSGFEVVTLYQEQGRYSTWGSWGLRENGAATLESAPKLRAVRRFMNDATGRITP